MHHPKWNQEIWTHWRSFGHASADLQRSLTRFLNMFLYVSLLNTKQPSLGLGFCEHLSHSHVYIRPYLCLMLYVCERSPVVRIFWTLILLSLLMFVLHAVYMCMCTLSLRSFCIAISHKISFFFPFCSDDEVYIKNLSKIQNTDMKHTSNGPFVLTHLSQPRFQNIFAYWRNNHGDLIKDF